MVYQRRDIISSLTPYSLPHLPIGTLIVRVLSKPNREVDTHEQYANLD